MAEANLKHEKDDADRAPMGLFLDACFHHCMKWDAGISINGTNQPAAFANFMGAAEQWYAGRGREANRNSSRIWLQQDYSAVDLPCKDCCIGVEHAELSAPQQAA